jgi:hypothetical protein
MNRRATASNTNKRVSSWWNPSLWDERCEILRTCSRLMSVASHAKRLRVMSRIGLLYIWASDPSRTYCNFQLCRKILFLNGSNSGLEIKHLITTLSKTTNPSAFCHALDTVAKSALLQYQHLTPIITNDQCRSIMNGSFGVRSPSCFRRAQTEYLSGIRIRSNQIGHR